MAGKFQTITRLSFKFYCIGIVLVNWYCDAGVKTYTCTVCSETKTEVLDATGHTPVDVAEQDRKSVV